jgi:hypothetical protein
VCALCLRARRILPQQKPTHTHNKHTHNRRQLAAATSPQQQQHSSTIAANMASSPPPPPQAAAPRRDTVKLVSAEGFEFIVDYKAACVSNTIRNMLSSQGAALCMYVIGGCGGDGGW